MRFWIIHSLLLALLLTTTRAAFERLQVFSAAQPADEAQSREVLYLPDGRGVELISFGYRHALGHILWFNTISYFAKHYRSDKNYKWLSNMCQIVSRLNPRAAHVYEFCSTMLAWEGGLAEESIKILDRAVAAYPANWLFFYLRGFTYSFFLKDDLRAKSDFVKAAALPDAHPIVIKLASKKILGLDSPEAAIQFLEEIIGSTKDERAKSAFRTRIKEARYEMQMRQLEKAVVEFSEKTGKPPSSLTEIVQQGLCPKELVESGLRDPFGGHYYLDPKDNMIKSSSNRKRPAVYSEKLK